MAEAPDNFADENLKDMEQLKQKTKKEKMLTLFDKMDSHSVEGAVKKIVETNIEDESFLEECRIWAQMGGTEMPALKLNPITMYISTYGGSCYDGMALYDTIKGSKTPVEVVCTGKVMSMGVIAILAAQVRKAHRNTTFMIHQLSSMAIGTLQDMVDSVEESSRVNSMLFDIITSTTRITKERLSQVSEQKKDWFFNTEEALELGVITEIID